MKLLLPTVSMRKRIVVYLNDFYDDGHLANYNRAVGTLATFYQVKLPKTRWVNSSDIPQDHGQCTSEGELVLIHPDSWQKRRTHNTKAKWISTFLHEMSHYLLSVDSELKADQFATRMIRGTGAKDG